MYYSTCFGGPPSDIRCGDIRRVQEYDKILMIDMIKIVTVKSQLYELNKKIFEVCSLQVLAGEHVKISQIDKVIKKCKIHLG